MPLCVMVTNTKANNNSSCQDFSGAIKYIVVFQGTLVTYFLGNLLLGVIKLTMNNISTTRHCNINKFGYCVELYSPKCGYKSNISAYKI